MGGAEGRGETLDYCDPAGAAESEHVETAVSGLCRVGEMPLIRRDGCTVPRARRARTIELCRGPVALEVQRVDDARSRGQYSHPLRWTGELVAYRRRPAFAPVGESVVEADLKGEEVTAVGVARSGAAAAAVGPGPREGGPG